MTGYKSNEEESMNESLCNSTLESESDQYVF